MNKNINKAINKTNNDSYVPITHSPHNKHNRSIT